MVYAIIYSLRSSQKRELLCRLGVPIGESACLVDRSEADALSVYTRVVTELAVACGVTGSEVLDIDEALYVIPVAGKIAGHGNGAAYDWMARRGLF